MKIKYWLVGSYLIVMLLPIVSFYFLYLKLSHYDNKQNIKEYMDFQDIVTELDYTLNNPSLYRLQTADHYEHINQLANDQLKIVLYKNDGAILYSSMKTPDIGGLLPGNRDLLYKDLNELKKGPRTYSIKQTVFSKGQMIGIYEITVSRQAWVEETKKRTTTMLVIFGIFFVLVYVVVLYLLNKKLNKPLRLLQTHMAAFASDKKMPGSLPKSNDEIGELLIRFEEMKEQIIETRTALQKEQEDKEFMVAALSHDLKTPLTVIRTYTEALEQDTQLSEEMRSEYREILYKKLDHMKQMIDDLAIYTALQSSQNSLSFVAVHGEEFFEMLFSGFDEVCENARIHLQIETKVQRAYRLDPKQMVRVIDNLMDNAIRHTKKAGEIGIAAISSRHSLPEWVYGEVVDELNDWREEGTVIIIQNDGDTIPSTQLTQIFEPFFQADDSRSSKSGATSGLGLSISKMLIEQHGGSIKAWSVQNKGTVIACWLRERGLI